MLIPMFPLAVSGDLVNLLCPFIDAVVFNALILVDIVRRDKFDVGLVVVAAAVGFIVVDGDLFELL